jgi:hypothetical protein
MSDFGMTQPASRSGFKFKHIMLLLLLAFVGGAIATWWLASEYGYLDSDEAAPAAPIIVGGNAPSVTGMAPALPPSTSVGEIENRLTQINADAAAASGSAARAESLLVAFAARRAIDSGASLGYLADQLRVRFGATQPQAVTTILAASQAPVTIEMLQAELTGLEPALLTGRSDGGVWTTIQREFSELFVLRKEGAPSPAPSQRLARAHALVESGNVAGAIAEVSAMPGAAAAQSWLVRARRYSDARKALDRLERGALAAPVAPVIVPPPAVPQPAPESPEAAPVP